MIAGIRPFESYFSSSRGRDIGRSLPVRHIEDVVQVGAEETRVEVEGNAEGAPLVVLAHGAGGDMDSKTILKLRDELLSRNLSVARFNFLYKQQKKSLP